MGGLQHTNTHYRCLGVPYIQIKTAGHQNPDKLWSSQLRYQLAWKWVWQRVGRRYIFPSFSHVNLVSPRHTTQPRELFSTNQNPTFRFVTGTQNHLGTSRGRMSSVGNSTLIYYPSLLSDGARFCFFTCLFFPRAAYNPCRNGKRRATGTRRACDAN